MSRKAEIGKKILLFLLALLGVIDVKYLIKRK